MHALPILIVVLCALTLGYRYYSAFIAAKVCVLDDSRTTPAFTRRDGQNYQPMSKWVLFGHHFAAISGAGPLIGPVLAAQFGFLPGLLWLVIGVVLAGAVQDFVILVASTRRGGRSLAAIASQEIGPVAGIAAGAAILFVLVISLAGLGIVVVNALSQSPWGTFTLAMTIPIALVMGFYVKRYARGDYRVATVFGVGALIFAVVAGQWVAASPVLARYFTLTKNQITAAIAIYGFVASVLPVWALLLPRDYLSSFMKIGTIAALIVGVIVVNPLLRLPAVTPYIHGGGPIFPGPWFPFLFITIMCGAISGFHSLVATGTTPKMISTESDCRTIGYGCMLIEGLVGVVALIAVAGLSPGDYFAINVPPAKFQTLHLSGLGVEELPVLEAQVKEKVAGRTGGAVSLAIGMAKIFSRLPGLKGLLAYWYHFAIMFEALFILTTIDAGTRIARFVLQEYFGKLYRPWQKTSSVSGTVVASLITVIGWSYFIFTGSISTIWPMFGVANQLLSIVALCIATTIILRSGRGRYVWVTLAPMCFVMVTTICGALELLRSQFLPWMHSALPADRTRGFVDAGLTLFLLVCLAVVLFDAMRKWNRPADELEAEPA